MAIYIEHETWYISISNQGKHNGGKIEITHTDNIIGTIMCILNENDYDPEYELTVLPNLIMYYGLTKTGDNLIIIAQWHLTETKRYMTKTESFGLMPYAGYLSAINQTIAQLDGCDVLACLNLIDNAADDLYKNSKKYDYEENEAFIILSYDESQSMELQYEVLFDLNNSELKFDYPVYAYRLYTRNDDWGLDEIELA